MLPHTGSLELRLADLEAHLDRLNSSLQQLARTGEVPHPVEQHLAHLADRCSDIVKQWAATSERHAVAVTELEAKLNDWNDVAARLQRDATWRFQELERLIEHEWASLRRLHEEPVRQLRDQAESLTEICVSTAGSAQTGIERADARLASLERDMHRRMDDLTRDVHAVLDELRQQSGAPVRSPASSWALDEVTRLHNEIRDGASVSKGPAPTSALRPISTQSLGDMRAPKPAEPVDADTGDMAVESDVSDRSEGKWFVAVGGLVLVLLIAGGFSFMFYNRAKIATYQAAAGPLHAET